MNMIHPLLKPFQLVAITTAWDSKFQFAFSAKIQEIKKQNPEIRLTCIVPPLVSDL